MSEKVSSEVWKDLGGEIREPRITEGDVWVANCNWCKNKGIKNEDEWIEFCKQKETGDTQIRIMPSKYSGVCKVCKKPIKVGDSIAWERSMGAIHEGCYKEEGCEFVSSCTVEDCHTRIVWAKTNKKA